MLKNRLNAANAVQSAFLPAEQAAEEAFQLVVSLLGAMNTARLDAHLPLQTGRSGFKHVSAAVHAASELRDHMLAAHAELVDVRSSILPARAVGDTDDCPGGTGTTKAARKLQAVG